MEQQRDKLFRNLFASIRDDDPENVITSMENTMYVLLDEREDINEELLLILLSKLGCSIKGVNEAARKLAMNVIVRCAVKLEPAVKQFLISSMSEDGPSNRRIDYHGVIYDLYRCSPQILSGVIPYITGKLLNDQSEVRNRAVNLVGELFAIPDSVIPEAFQPLFVEFLKRLTDSDVDVRMTVLDFVKKCLLSNPSRPDAAQIFSALCDRLLDDDENVRKQVVAVVDDVACFNLDSVPVETTKLIAERLDDRNLALQTRTVKIEGKERLDAYKGPEVNRESRDASEHDDEGKMDVANMEVSTNANKDENTHKSKYEQSKPELDVWEEDNADISTQRFESSRDVLTLHEECNRLSRNASMNSGTRTGQPPQFGLRGSMLSSTVGTGMGYSGMSPQICGFGGQDMRMDGRNIYESGTLSVPLPQRRSSHEVIPPLQPSSTQVKSLFRMSKGDDRRARHHASYHRKKINVRLGDTSFGSKEVSIPTEPETEPDFYAPGGEYDQYLIEFQEEERNYHGSKNEVEAANEEATGNMDAGNVEVTSALRVRRGQYGRFATYTDGSSSSVPEPRRKVRASGKDSSWILTGFTWGGPLIPDVIPSFGGHIAHSLWSQPQSDRTLLTKYTRERSLVELRKWNLSDAVRKIVEDSGLSHLPKIMHKQINMPLICAFIERWQPDTNTFHMPWGEMTILLHDVEKILGIGIDGFSCSISKSDMAHPVLGMSELLGMAEAELREQWGPDKDSKIYKGNLILNKALKEMVQGDMRGFEAEAQGYLMILLSSTLFVDKSSDRVRANTFPMLRDVDCIGEYAWGAGTLAYLYRQLGIATRADCKGLCGCLTLLQSWIFEYFPSFRPMSMLVTTPFPPRASLWSTSTIPRVEAEKALVTYREQLDLMSIELVAWTPYANPPETEHPRSLYHGVLRFIDIVEPYQPDRCLRQFGYTQTIPTPMARPDKEYRPVKSIDYDVQYDGAYLDYIWNNWTNHRMYLDKVSLPAHPPHAYAKGYMEWFVSHSHPYVMNVPRFSDQIPVARSHFPTTVGQSLIQMVSQFENVDDLLISREFKQFIRTAHPLMRAYTGRPSQVVRGSRGRGRRRGLGPRTGDRAVVSRNDKDEGGDNNQIWSKPGRATNMRTY